MKKILVFSMIILLRTGASLANEAEFRLVESRNDMSLGGEFHLDLQIRIVGGTSPRTLNSLTADIDYTSTLTQWQSDPSVDWGPDCLKGYTTDASRLSGYYRVLITGGNVGSGKGTGWNVTTEWQNVVTLRWIINTATLVHIRISDATDAASYFENPGNDPEGPVIDWSVSNQDPGDVSLPVEITGISASASSREGVVLSWSTGSEVNCAGFHVWRGESRNGGYEKITTALIEGQGNSSSARHYTYADRNVETDVLYWYRIEEIGTDGSSRFFGPISAMGISPIPTEFSLSQNYPNPFNPKTHFEYQIPQASRVAIHVYDLLGKDVALLVDAQQEPGCYTVRWDGTDGRGGAVPSGIYLLRFQAGTFHAVRKMTIMR